MATVSYRAVQLRVGTRHRGRRCQKWCQRNIEEIQSSNDHSANTTRVLILEETLATESRIFQIISLIILKDYFINEKRNTLF
ncbi:MAG: hypothetical protein ACFFBQ_18505 [Promethearchaeota archaeon]